MKEQAWIDAMLKGNEQAGEWFVREHYPRIYSLLTGLCGSTEVAQDLAQQTFVKAWQAMATFRKHSLIRTWLHRIAYHEYLHWLRDRKEHTSLDSVEELPSTTSQPLEALALEQALLRLSEDLRLAFLLHYVQDFSVKEVAEVLNVPMGTVKSRLFTARQRLREILQSSETDDAPQIPAKNDAFASPLTEVTPDEMPQSIQHVSLR